MEILICCHKIRLVDVTNKFFKIHSMQLLNIKQSIKIKKYFFNSGWMSEMVGE